MKGCITISNASLLLYLHSHGASFLCVYESRYIIDDIIWNM